MLIQPKPYIEKIRHRHVAIGPERRLNTVRTIMDKGTILPKAVTYEDIDQTVFDWVDKTLDISYNGKRLPTFKLFSNQRISEYAQTWSNLDDEGNVAMNFKSITRDNNPQKGENQGMMCNIPGNRRYSLFKVPVLEENGEEVLEVYSMRQPIAVNFSYVIVLVCDKYRLLNEMNTKIHDQFKSLECYVFPNGHPMPMLLDTIDDESEYTIGDRKYYSQAYRIKLMGYIIQPEDFSVAKVPSRFKIGILGLGKKKVVKGPKTLFSGLEDELDSQYVDTTHTFDGEGAEGTGEYSGDTSCIGTSIDLNLPTVSIIEVDDAVPCEDEESPYYYKRVNLDIEFPVCDRREVEFELDFNMGVDELEIENINDFKIYVNGVEINIDECDDPVFKIGDKIMVRATAVDELETSLIRIVGYDMDVAIPRDYSPESALDDIVTGEDMMVDRSDGDKVVVTGQTTDPIID